LGDDLKLCLKVSAVIAGRGHASLFVVNGSITIKQGKATGPSQLALLELVNLKITN
jgi:hypothetical protein